MLLVQKWIFIIVLRGKKIQNLIQTKPSHLEKSR